MVKEDEISVYLQRSEAWLHAVYWKLKEGKFNSNSHGVNTAYKIFQLKLHLLVHSKWTKFYYHLKDIYIHYLNHQTLKFSLDWFSRVDVFKICIQDCVLLGFPPLLVGYAYSLLLLSCEFQPIQQFAKITRSGDKRNSDWRRSLGHHDILAFPSPTIFLFQKQRMFLGTWFLLRNWYTCFGDSVSPGFQSCEGFLLLLYFITPALYSSDNHLNAASRRPVCWSFS